MKKRAHAVRKPVAPEPVPPEPASRSFPWPWVLGLVVLVFVAFAPALRSEFLNWDDQDNITRNPDFRGLDAAHLKWMFTTDHMGPYQPLAWLSLAIDHALWGLGGPDKFPEAPGYHLTSVAIHALAAVAFLLLARKLLARVFARPPAELEFAAFVSAAFFAVHPLRVESVAWVTERRDVLCGLFFVLAIHAWLAVTHALAQREDRPARPFAVAAISAVALAALWLALDLSDVARLSLSTSGGFLLALGAALLAAAAGFAARGSAPAWRSYLLVLALFACALLSKGLALVLPAVLVVLDAWPLRRVRDARTLAAAIVEKMPLFALTALFARIAYWGQRGIPGQLASWTDHTIGERTLQAFFGLAFYVRKTLLPLHLSPFYELPDDLRLADPRFLLPMLAVLAALAVLLVKRRRVPGLAAAGIAYALTIAPVLGFSQAGPQITADRYSYLACLPFGLLAGAAVVLGRGRLARVAAVGVLAALAGLTFLQTLIWRTSTSLWEHAEALDPDVMMTNLNLGHARMSEAEAANDGKAREALLEDAERLFDRALAAREHPLALAGLAMVHEHRWELDPKNRAAEAEASLDLASRALALAKERHLETPEYHLNLGSAYGNAQRPKEAEEQFRAFLAGKPNSYLGHYLLGFLLLNTRQFAESERELTRALEIEPGAVNAWGNLGFAHEGLNEKDLAIQCYQRVLALAPGHPIAKQRLFALQTRMTVDVLPK